MLIQVISYSILPIIERGTLSNESLFGLKIVYRSESYGNQLQEILFLSNLDSKKLLEYSKTLEVGIEFSSYKEFVKFFRMKLSIEK